MISFLKLRNFSLTAAVLMGLVAAASGADLTGSWLADDGASYYVRQAGNSVWWVGISGDNGHSFTNVFHGRIVNGIVIGNWADLPLGGTMNYGRLTLRIVNVATPDGGGDVQFQKEAEAGGFSATSWRRGAIGRPPGQSDDPYPTAIGASEGLTGVWSADDGATYYVRQIGNTIWWAGLSADGGRSFTNVFHGTVRRSLGQDMIAGDWVDVPRGASAQMGTLGLDNPLLGSPSEPPETKLLKRYQTGGFGAKVWRPLAGN